MARAHALLVLGLLLAPLLGPTGAATAEQDRLRLETAAATYGAEEPVSFSIEHRDGPAFHGTAQIRISKIQAAGACETTGHHEDCPLVTKLYPGHLALAPGDRAEGAATWEQVDDRGRATGEGSYVARLWVYSVTRRVLVDEARFDLAADQHQGPGAGLVGPQEEATLTRGLNFHWWARDPDGLRYVNTSLLDERDRGAIFLDHRSEDELPADGSTAYGGAVRATQTLGRLGPNELVLFAYPRTGEGTHSERLNVILALRNVSFEPAKPSFSQGEDVRLDVTNTGTVTLEGPARWNISGHANPDADGWMHEEPTYRFAPLEPDQTRELVWDAPDDTPPGEYTAYLGIRGHLGSATFLIDESDEHENETLPPPANDTVPPDTNETVPPEDVNETVPEPARNVTIGVGANATLTARNATVEIGVDGHADPDAIPKGKGTTLRFPGEGNHTVHVEGNVTVQQGETNALLRTEGGQRVLVIAPTGQGRVHASHRALAVQGSDRVLVQQVHPDGAIANELVPAWLDGRVGAAIDARASDPAVRAYSDLNATPRLVEGEDARVEVTLESATAEGRLVVVTLPGGDAFDGEVEVELDGETIPRTDALGTLVNATDAEGPGWVLVEQDGARALVAHVDHFSTRTLTIQPGGSIGWLPAALVSSFLVAVIAIFVLARD